ncbi:MAG: Asp23/Gls24 family envelope stress response protein [Clostridia bacterium]|nr:Asp23/Gls24 family envelope stress response protein [Clostridia bacterium]
MSENYPSDVKLNENPDGTVSFATEVVATIAGLAATEVDGVASMSSPSAGFADMFSRKNTRNFTKGVRIDLDGNKVTVDITIVVDYGSPVPDVARSIQENVKKAIETMSGLDVRSVDVHVSGISFEREQRANAELDEQQRKMLEKTEESVEEAVKEAKAEAEEAVAEEADPEDDLDLEIDDDPDDEEPLDDEPAEEDPVADEAEDEPEEEPEETEEEKPEAAE